jgi:hypothetical protein
VSVFRVATWKHSRILVVLEHCPDISFEQLLLVLGYCSDAVDVFTSSMFIYSKEISLKIKRALSNTIFICSTWTLDVRTIRKITTTEIECIMRLTFTSLRNEDLRTKFKTVADISYIKRQK